MVRKVELDLFEEGHLPGLDAPLKEEEPVKNGKGWRSLKWLTKKKIILAAILFFFSGIVGVSLLMFSEKKDTRVDHSAEFTEVRSIHENIENLDSFVIDLRDEHGNYRVLVCEIAIVVNKDKKISANKVEMRNMAYNALKKKGKYVLTSSKAYSAIKKELRDELDGLLGGGVKEVYFTKFILL